ncbi:hypothetical protein PV327_011697, partial [Microctonus hyperodae]
ASISSSQENSIMQSNGNNVDVNTANTSNDINMILDEGTGLFVPHRGSSTVTENVIQDYSNCILDEKTGLFVECGYEMDQLYEKYSSFSLSSNQCSQEVTSQSTDDSNHISKKFDEYSGRMEKKRRKKGQGNPLKWEQNKTKRARMNGKSYHSKQRVKDKVVGLKKREKRRLKPTCDSKYCEKSDLFKCNEITKAQREELFKSFWKNYDWKERKVMINNLIQKRSVTRRTQNGDSFRRNTSVNGQFSIG